jgi:hypothetical protein
MALRIKRILGPSNMYAPQQERVSVRRSYLRDSVASLCAVPAETTRNAHLQENTVLPDSAASEQRRAAPKLPRGMATINLAKRSDKSVKAMLLGRIVGVQTSAGIRLQARA